MDNLTKAQMFDPYAHGLASGSADLYAPYLGEPRVASVNPHSLRNTAKWNMPEAYHGSSLYLRDTVEDYMLTAKWDFWTERILPWYRTDEIHVQWTQWSNNAHYMSITPHQTSSRVVTQKRTIRRASIVRRGIGAEFENDFIKTSMGRASFMAALGQIARSIQETANVEVLRALINCHRYQAKMYRSTQVASYNDLDEMHKRQASRFMCAQKEKYGLERITTEIDTDMEAVGGQADVWILSGDVSNYIRTTRPEKTDYYLGGQEAVDRINSRGAVRTVARGNTMGVNKSIEPYGVVGGQEVYLARSYQIDNGIQLDLLSRTAEVGIYNTMIDRTRDYTKYRSAGRNIQVYNNDDDAWAEIELVEAIDNCSVWLHDGKIEGGSFKKQAGSGGSLHQDENDFLSQPSPTQAGVRENIKFVGEMSPLFLKTEHLQNAAQTVLNALKKTGFKEESIVLPTDGTTSLAAMLTAIGTLTTRLRQLMGNSNRVLNGAGQYQATMVQARIAALLTADTHDLVLVSTSATGGAASIGSDASAEPSEAGTQIYLKNSLGVAVPDSHKAELNAIADNTSLSWIERSQAIRSLVEQCATEHPERMRALKTPTAIDAWYNARFNEQKKIVAKEAASIASGVSASSAGTTHEYHFVEAGTKLAPGQTLLHAAGNNNVMARLALVSKPPASHSRIGATVAGMSENAPGARTGGVSREQHVADAVDRVIYGNNWDRQLNKLLAAGSMSGLLKTLAIVFMGTPFERDIFKSYAQNNIYVPLGFLLFRPHCQYKTRYGIRCGAGGASGYTLFGHSDMQLGTAASNKVGLMHYTAYLSSIVMYPKNVYILEDLFCKKYLGGMGVSWWTPDLYKRSTNRRLRSIICAPLPPTRRTFESNKMDIRGRWYTQMELNLSNDQDANQVHYEGSQRICQLYQLKDATRKNQQAARGKAPPNNLCWAGAQWHFNTKNNTYDSFIIEAGHFGQYVYPGAGKVRNGVKTMLVENGHLGTH